MPKEQLHKSRPSKKILSVVGTRPEAIKMAPLIRALNAESSIESRLCITAQHRQMLDQVLSLFNIRADYDLDIMKCGQSLSDVTSSILSRMEHVLKDFQPDMVLVHGDTATTFAASLACYYQHIPIGHVEAGLRTGNMYAPWPEEANRRLTAVLASLHFAPTERSRQNLLQENVSSDTIHVVGNTVIDALLQIQQHLGDSPDLYLKQMAMFPFLRDKAPLILITGHRRENFGDGFEGICQAIVSASQQYPEADFLYPVHMNPNVREPVERILKNAPNVYLTDPLDYLPFVALMTRSYIILTDSGGIQEEAPSLGKPVLVMRETTERPEAVKAGTVKLVGTAPEKILCGIKNLMESKEEYERMTFAHNPYGDGKASTRIVQIIRNMDGKEKG